ncbi:uncharacterized protein J8A68_003551 [[Candida] subhashii]|uniref:Uncharacterized protein n=1 Tax=[Candida] subhashii TaxID=561895 RepID=A0A8J5QLZ9_9ASCO|nr:uncharacterized protein J8A68_003551 [[Candida] subhashii]KAG7662925.1 hypothetical protein J8A68_003551 [[Candida] subhashii]
MQLLVQSLVSILYVTAGILFIIHDPINTPEEIGIVVTYITSIIFLTASIILSFVFIQQTNAALRDVELSESDKSSTKSSPIVTHTAIVPMPSDSKDKATQQLQYFEQLQLQQRQQKRHFSNSTPITPIRNSLYSNNQKESHRIAHCHSLSTLISDSKISRDPSSLLFDDSINHIQTHEIGRSKSTNCIPNKTQVRKQRWKSINDEKLFLSNIDESLLPPVLKVHSKQVSVDEQISQQPQLNGELNTQLTEYPKNFKIRKSKSEYVTTLTGLENIPEPPIKKRSPSDNWNLAHYEHTKLQQGLNLNISGISNLVSDGNLKGFEYKKQEIFETEEFLLPPKEPRSDNIDHLSDISSSNTRIPSSRSISAPSLHTFRKISQTLSEEISEKTTSSSFALEPTCPTTPPAQISVLSIKTTKSPLKSLFRETSPKKIFKQHNRTTSLWGSNNNSPKKFASSQQTTPRTPAVYHKYSISEPNTALFLHASPFPQSANSINKFVEPIDLWDVNTSISRGDDIDDDDDDEISRLGSPVGSVILGEYDHEKWRTLKALSDNQPVM